MPASEAFLLNWKKTWPHLADDFIARVPDAVDSFIRVYRQKATSEPSEAWLWIVTIGGERVASGHEVGARPAVRAAERAWAE